MSRYVLAAGYSASKVGAMMAIVSIADLAAGRTSWVTLVDIFLLVGLVILVWWRRSPVPAVLMLGMVVYEYVRLVISGERYLRLYAILFVVAFILHVWTLKRRAQTAT
jgi:hypothetical protein